MSLIASVGVVVASAALLIVLSVFSGLKEFSLEFTNVTDPDLKLFPSKGKSVVFSSEDQNKLQQIEGIALWSKIVEERIVVQADNKNLLATLKGVDTNYNKVTKVDSMVSQGQWLQPKTDEVVCGWGISNSLSFGIFNYLKPLTLYVPKPGKGQGSSVKSYFNSSLVTNVGLFSINENLDNEYIFSDIELAQSLLSYSSDQISAIELQLHSNADEDSVREAIQNTFPNQFSIKNREQLNDSLFKMLNTENLAIYLIFTLVIIIALFNVIGAIIMMVLDKKKSINTLFNLGAELKTIKSVFFLQGTLMTVLSGILGTIIGVLVVLSQKLFQWIMINPEFPYPVRLEVFNIVTVLVTIFLLGIVASKLASQRITPQLVKTT